MTGPAHIIVPTLHTDWPALIQWDDVVGATGYTLYRQVNDGPIAETFGSAYNEYQDYIPDDVSTITYAVSAFLDSDLSWDSLDEEETFADWDASDALDLPWEAETSELVYSGPHAVVGDQEPVISGRDENLGGKMRGFDVVFSVSDPNPGNSIDVIVTLDGNLILTAPNVQQNVPYTVKITDEQLFAMEPQSEHEIVITATDNKGLSSTRTYTFTAIEDLIASAVFYMLRDGVPVAKMAAEREWRDFMQVGTHTYVVRAVDKYDNYVDSNEVTLTIAVDYSTIALCESPSRMLTMIVREGEYPTVEHVYMPVFESTMYEGRVLPVISSSEHRSSTWTFGFTHRTTQERDSIQGIAALGQPVVYRDNFDNRVIGYIENISRAYRRQGNPTVIDFNVQISEVDYQEEIPYD